MDGTKGHSIPVPDKGPPHRVLARRYRRRPLIRAIARLGISSASVALFARCVPSPSQASQPVRVPRVGYVSVGGTPGRSLVVDAFRLGLQELGYREGQNLILEYRSAAGRPERQPELASELVELPVDIIVTEGGNTGARAARSATSTIPIVMMNSGVDPVSAGLVASLARPGGNITGFTTILAELSAKRLELLKEAVPSLTRVALLWNGGQPDKLVEVRETRVAADALGVVVQSLEVRDGAELAVAFEAARHEQADGLIVLEDNLTRLQARQIADLSLVARLPSVYSASQFIDAGGLLMYGPDNIDLARRSAEYVDKILKGARPGDLPVERPTKFDLLINLRTARALGIELPHSLRVQATGAIE